MVWTRVTYIWTGDDHLAFLFGLLLPGGRLRTLVGIVSAFTVAHSLTLALAALGVVSAAPSIACSHRALHRVRGLENLFARIRPRRWRVHLSSVVHGFGFAGALRDSIWPRAQMPIALCAFNLGVEMGRSRWSRRCCYYRVGAASLGVSSLGVRGLSVALSLADSAGSYCVSCGDGPICAWDRCVGSRSEAGLVVAHWRAGDESRRDTLS